MPVGQPVDADASLQMGQCGREMVVTIQGMSVVLNKSVMNDSTWSGAINMGDGVARNTPMLLVKKFISLGGTVDRRGIENERQKASVV